MDEYQESNHNENGWASLHEGSNRWLAIAVVVLLAIAGVAFAYASHQKSELSQATAQAATANAAVAQMQNQVNALTAKLNEVTAAQAPLPSSSPASAPVLSADVIPPTQEASSTPAAKPKRALPKHHVVRRRPHVDKKYLELQAQLADQQKQLKATQDEVAKDRADLEGSINSTRDDLNSTRDNLNGSIAKNHDELVALEKRGERSYFEFDLSKSKEFERVGPLTLSLRKADTKHKHYNLAMIVDDNELQKKNVNLYEPIWIHAETDGESVQIVVNKIDKNSVHGYISAPKYKPSELAAAASSSPSVTPVSAKSTATTPSNMPNPQPPQQ
jgi:DNA repair exonuclease SbcCD ATPase subunit